MKGRRLARPVFLAAAVALGIAASWLLPRDEGRAPTRPRLTAILVDASATVASDRAWLSWVRAELRRAALAARAAGEELAVLSYADGVALGFGPGSPAEFLARLEARTGRPFDPRGGLPRGGTELAAALEALEPEWSAQDRPPAHLLLLAEPSYTGPSPAGALARFTELGGTLELCPPPAGERADLALLELRLPGEVEAGSELVALARLHYRPGRHAAPAARVELEVECDGVLRELLRPLALPAGGGTFECPLPLGPAGLGRNSVRARLAFADGNDRLPENDTVRAWTTAEGARAVGVLVRPEARALAEAWLAPGGRSALAGLQFEFFGPDEFGIRQTGLSAVVSFDLALEELPSELLLAFVRAGGGWLALAGPRFLGDWIPGETEGPLHRALPLEPAQSEATPRDVVLLVDGSGSMEGAPFETVRTASQELVSAALPSDRVSLRFFTAVLEPEHLLKERVKTRAEDVLAARAAARELLALRIPQGTTFLLSSMQSFLATREGTETLAFLLTDGRERDQLPDRLRLAETVRAELAAARVRLVVVAMGDAERELLGVLAGGAENLRDGNGLADLRAVFHRELNGPQLALGSFPLMLAAREPGSLADEVVSAAESDAALPTLQGYTRSRLRSQGEALWQSSEGDPVLALGREGLGRTALFASKPGSDWAPGLARPGLGEPAEFEGLLRWLARRGAPPAGPRAHLEGRRLWLSGLAPSTPPVLEARLSVPSVPEPFRLRLTPPSRLGVDPVGSREGVLAVEPSAGERESTLLVLDSGLALPVETGLAEEFAWGEHPVPAEWLAAAPESAAVRPAGLPSESASPWALAFLGLGFVLAFLGVLLAARHQGSETFGR